MSKKLRFGLLSLAALGMFLVGCQELGAPDTTPPPDESGTVRAQDLVYVTDIIAGQNEDVGDIEVSFSYDYIYITYETTGDWYLYEAHAHVAGWWEDIPTVNGNPAPGQFDYKDEFDDTQYYVFSIPWDSTWRDLDSLYIAAHCALHKIVDEEIVQEETGWGDGEDFPGNNWAMWFSVPVPKLLQMPSGGVKFKYVNVYGNIPRRFYVIAKGDPNDLPTDYYHSFCMQYGIYIYNQYYDGWAYSGYDWANLPDWAKYKKDSDDPIPYDAICYLINLYPPPQYPNTTLLVQMQNVIWVMTGWKTYASLTTAEKAMYDDAMLNGDGYYPTASGAWLPIVLTYSSAVQVCFIQVDP